MDPILSQRYDTNPSLGFKSLLAREDAVNLAASLFSQNSDHEHTDAFREMAASIYTLKYTNDYRWSQFWSAKPETDANTTEKRKQEIIMDFNNGLIGRLAVAEAGINGKTPANEVWMLIHQLYMGGELKKLYNSDGGYNAVTFSGRLEDYTKHKQTAAGE